MELNQTVDDPRFFPEIEVVDGMPIPPSVPAVLILEGSNYEIGYQYAQQMCHVLGAWALERIRLDLTEPEIGSLKKFLELTKKYTPEFVDIFRGMADGSSDAGVEMSFWQAMASHFVGWDGRIPVYTPGKEYKPLDAECSGMAAWGSATKDGKVYAIGTGDGPDTAFNFIIMVIPNDGNSYVCSTLPSLKFDRPIEGSLFFGGHPGMNNKGLAYAHHGSGIDAEEKPDYGIPLFLQEQHTLRYCDNVSEALVMQKSYPKGMRAHGVWADKNDGFVMECRYPEAVRRAGDHGEQDFLYATNTCLDKSLEKYMSEDVHNMGWPLFHVEHGGWNNDDLNSVRRNLYMWNMLHNYHGEVDHDFLELMLHMPSPAPEYDTLEEAEQKFFETHGVGWDLYIANKGNCMVCLAEPEDGNTGSFYAGRGYIARQTDIFNPGLCNTYYKNMFAMYKLTLAENADAIVAAAQKQLHYDMYNADKQLQKLDYHDPAYAPLTKIMDDACLQNMKASHELYLARAAEGNEALYHKSKALRCLTRSQVYCKHVYEALVPPATSPTDLGLREWMGDWGEWAQVLGCPEEQKDETNE